MHRGADFDLPSLQRPRWQRAFELAPPIESARTKGQLHVDGDAERTIEVTPHTYDFERDGKPTMLLLTAKRHVLGGPSAPSACFAGFALSAGPVLPQSVVARALVSFNAIVAAADAGKYLSLTGPKQSCDAPHVQEVVQNLASGSTEALRKVSLENPSNFQP
eukprot:SAG31_NODE_850_length_11521_cov_47.558396_15_plen_162_part_00